MTLLAVELCEGAVVVDRYKLEARLGAGSMGSVWAARHMQLGHRVAMKFLNTDTNGVVEAKERFMLEGQLAAQLGHTSKNIVKVLDHGVLPVRSGGEIVERPFLVMEHLAGESLAQRIHKRGRLSLAEMRPLVRQMALALSAIHRIEVIHRDLKPGNVFLVQAQEGDNKDELVKVLDFGIAKTANVDLTAMGTILGTPGFMSPEQVRGDRDVDARVDLWALAATVYAAVVGEPPFGDGTVGELTARVLWSRVVPPSEKLGHAMPGFDLWIARGLAREPSARFQSATELAQSFEAVLIEEDAGVPKLPFGLSRSNDATEAYANNFSGVAMREPRRNLLRGGAVLVVLVALGALVIRGRQRMITPVPAIPKAPVLAPALPPAPAQLPPDAGPVLDVAPKPPKRTKTRTAKRPVPVRAKPRPNSWNDPHAL